MSDGTSGSSIESGASDQTQQKPDSYPKDFVEKLLKEKKNAMSAVENAEKQAQELKDKLAEYENKKLEEQGRYQELLQAERDRLKAKENEYSVLKTTIIQDRVKNSIMAEAVKLGCVDVDALIKVGDLSKIAPDPKTLDVDTNEVKSFVNEMLATKPYLFKAQAPTINDLPPGVTPPAATDITKLSRDELRDMLAKAK